MMMKMKLRTHPIHVKLCIYTQYHKHVKSCSPPSKEKDKHPLSLRFLTQYSEQVELEAKTELFMKVITVTTLTWRQLRSLPAGSFFHLFTSSTQALHISPERRSWSWKQSMKSSSYFLLSVNLELQQNDAPVSNSHCTGAIILCDNYRVPSATSGQLIYH